MSSEPLLFFFFLTGTEGATAMIPTVRLPTKTMDRTRQSQPQPVVTGLGRRPQRCEMVDRARPMDSNKGNVHSCVLGGPLP